MSKTQSIHKVIKRTIRSHTTDTPALEREVKAELREQFKDFPHVCDVYERLRKHGEIYSYDTDEGCVVKVTEDQL
jgi:hypothetical protein